MNDKIVRKNYTKYNILFILIYRCRLRLEYSEDVIKSSSVENTSIFTRTYEKNLDTNKFFNKNKKN